MDSSKKRIIPVRFSDTEVSELVGEKNKLALENNSDFVRLAVFEKIRSEKISNISGNNIIEYDGKKDSFVWKVKTDNGAEKVVLDNLSTEFLDDLQQSINFQLKKREELLGKKKRKSIALPKKLMK